MDSMRSTVSQFPAPLGPNSFAYGEGYVQNEQYKAIGREALTNIGLALLMVFVVVFLLLVNPLGAGITFVCIALVVVELVSRLSKDELCVNCQKQWVNFKARLANYLVDQAVWKRLIGTILI